MLGNGRQPPCDHRVVKLLLPRAVETVVGSRGKSLCTTADFLYESLDMRNPAVARVGHIAEDVADSARPADGNVEQSPLLLNEASRSTGHGGAKAEGEQHHVPLISLELISGEDLHRMLVKLLGSNEPTRHFVDSLCLVVEEGHHPDGAFEALLDQHSQMVDHGLCTRFGGDRKRGGGGKGGEE